MGETFLLIVPFIVLSAAIYAYVSATQADSLIAGALRGRQGIVIVTAALFGALSPFCSCGVIPLVATLLAIGVPLAPVMAFWLASPVIDPVMYLLTAGIVGWEFATAKALGAIALGLLGGGTIYALEASGRLSNPLRPGVMGSHAALDSVGLPYWRFWEDPRRVSVFRSRGLHITFIFLLESLLIAYVPNEAVVGLFGGTGLWPIVVATLIGIPAYVNGYVAVPLVAELLNKGMQPGAAMAFLVAGGVTSIPAMIAVVAVVRLNIVLIYVALAFGGSLAWGLLYQAWVSQAWVL
jgi:uncharacterized membrane protein YraQ (UPF0718 family)